MNMIAFALLAPLLAAILAVAAIKSHKYAKYFAIAGSLLSLALFPLIDSGTENVGWLSIGGVQLPLTASVLPLNYMLLFLVLTIGPLIMIYSAGFMDLPSEQRRYYIEMLAFEAAMLTFAMAGNFIVLFIAWEFLSMTSYLLIGFWYDRDKAAAAARKAITIILIGDIALLASMVMFQNNFGSLQFSVILNGIGNGGLTLIPVALLFIAIMTKSAQFPTEEWLVDAMEGPTPVSAFLHSSTMVKAGVFVALVLFPLFAATGMLNVMLAVGAITVALAVFSATRSRHVKRVLAYSTVQELGFMLVAIGSNALLAAVYFFFAQSFYKALLFFSAGSTMKATGKEDLADITGLQRNRLIYITTIFGALALAGFIPFDGFFANIGIDSAFSTNLIAYALVSLASLATSFYIFRWLFSQTRKEGSARVSLNYASTPKSMSYSMLVLALATLGASVAFFMFPSMFSGLGGGTLTIGAIDGVVETVLIAIGAYVGFVLYKQRKRNRLKMVQPEVLFNTIYSAALMNAFYAHIAGFVEAIASAVAYADAKLDAVFDWLGHIAMRASGEMRLFASGSVNAYVALFAAGMVVLIIVVVAL